MRILLIEDDDLIVQPLTKVLNDQHYVVDTAIDGQAGWELADVFNYDLILLNVKSPKLDGISFCRRLRSQGNQTPIILLTDQDTSTNKVLGLDAGADDYLAKPFDFQELLARMRALLRRSSSALPPLLIWRNIQLDPSTCEVTCDDHSLHLTPKEYSLLELFLRNPHRIFSCSALIDHLWSMEEAPTEETVRSHVKGLRQKLKAAGVAEDPLVTIYGIGYRLKAGEREGQHEDIEIRAGEMRASAVSRRAEREVAEKSATLESQGSGEAKRDDGGETGNDEAMEPMQADMEAQVSEGVAKIWAEVKEQLGQRATVVEQATNLWLREQMNDDLRQQAYQEAHKLAGSLGMFGADEGSQLALAIESFFAPGTVLDLPQKRYLTQLVQALQRELQTIGTGKLPELLSDEVESEVALALPNKPEESIEARILAVDDDPQVLSVLRQLLTPWGFKVATLDRPQRLLSTLKTATPDLLILDVAMPQMNGIELCQQIRNQPQWGGLPILFLTAHTDAKTMHQVFAAGADDYVTKPITGPELVIRILNRLERSRLLRHFAETDALTGVYNRRKSSQELLRSLQECITKHHPFCFAVFDLDHLKYINHRHGHAAADQVLVKFGELLRHAFQNGDVVGRWGGTEFVMGMPQTTKQVGRQRLAEVLKRLEQIEFTTANGSSFQVTGNTGIVEYPQDGNDLQSLYQAADTALDQAKVAACPLACAAE